MMTTTTINTTITGNIVTAFLIMSVGEFLVIVTAGLIKEKPVKISLG